MTFLYFILFTLIVIVFLRVIVSLRASSMASSAAAAASSSSSAAAASSSSSSSSIVNPGSLRCSECKSIGTTFITGWPLEDGTVAQLCHRCGTLYQKGSFCETFHRNTEGWIECSVCKKKLHCGCLVSKSEIHFTFFGRLCCKECAKKMIRG